MKLMKDEEEEQHQLHYLGFSIHLSLAVVYFSFFYLILEPPNKNSWKPGIDLFFLLVEPGFLVLVLHARAREKLVHGSCMTSDSP